MNAAPQRIDRYLIEAELGRGSFGAVYRARHTVMGREVALKVLHPERATTPSVLERFLGEARAVAAIGSPHIVQMFDAGLTPDGKAFLAMELLQGEDLAHHLERRGRLSPTEAVRIGREVCLALAAAHRAGVVHRDLKPANIFLARDASGVVHAKVLDFGVSKITRPEGEELTMTGTMLGTPHYMAPEQLSNSRGVDGRADLYAVGTVMFEMLSLSLPYDGTTLASLIAAKMSDAPRSLTKLAPDVPGPLATAVLRSLSWEPSARFSSADEMEQALAHALARSSATSAPPGPIEASRGTEPAMARTEFASSSLGASGAGTVTPSYGGPASPPQPAPVLAQSSLVSLPGIVNATTGPVAGTTDAPFKRLLAVLGVAFVGIAALAMVGVTLVAVALTYLGMSLAGESAPAAGPTLTPAVAPQPTVSTPTTPITPPSGALAPSPIPPAPVLSAPVAPEPSPATGARAHITPMSVGMDVAEMEAIARDVQPAVEACSVPASFDVTYSVIRMAFGSARAHAEGMATDAASACVLHAFEAVAATRVGGSGIARFHVTGR